MIRIIRISNGSSEEMTLANWTLPTYLEEMFIAGFMEFTILSADDTSVSLRYIGNQGLEREIIWNV